MTSFLLHHLRYRLDYWSFLGRDLSSLFQSNIPVKILKKLWYFFTVYTNANKMQTQLLAHCFVNTLILTGIVYTSNCVTLVNYSSVLSSKKVLVLEDQFTSPSPQDLSPCPRSLSP